MFLYVELFFRIQHQQIPVNALRLSADFGLGVPKGISHLEMVN